MVNKILNLDSQAQGTLICEGILMDCDTVKILNWAICLKYQSTT
jgi:hypothetical protein